MSTNSKPKQNNAVTFREFTHAGNIFVLYFFYTIEELIKNGFLYPLSLIVAGVIIVTEHQWLLGILPLRKFLL